MVTTLIKMYKKYKTFLIKPEAKFENYKNVN